jgi:hypothetical protein
VNGCFATEPANDGNRPEADGIKISWERNMRLQEQLEAVTDEATFLAFVQALANDRRSDGKTWGNDSIENFLEAAGSWADDSGFGAKQGLSAVSPWKKFAVFLYCGKIYE